MYWSIVTGLLAMVATLFLCIDILYGTRKGSSEAPGIGMDDSEKTAGSGQKGSRQAA
jgi:hypothetical protein